jgi:pyruvate carboxylase
MEVNPRIQVEHTVTEQVTGIDLVQSQIRLAENRTLREIGLVQKDIQTRGTAVQCRITTEDPLNNFAPDTGAGGMGLKQKRKTLYALQAASTCGGLRAALASVLMAAPCTPVPRCCPTTTRC